MNTLPPIFQITIKQRKRYSHLTNMIELVYFMPRQVKQTIKQATTETLTWKLLAVSHNIEDRNVRHTAIITMKEIIYETIQITLPHKLDAKLYHNNLIHPKAWQQLCQQLIHKLPLFIMG